MNVLDGSLIQSWRREEEEPVIGWDWSRFAGRRLEGPLPWDYERLAAAAMRQASSALDIGTGGGELLSRLRESFPPRRAASEGYAPNVPVARRRLEGLGVDVRASVNHELPFEDGSFDIVLNSHAGYRATEVARVLMAGGRYLMRRIDPSSHVGFRRAFGREPSVQGDSLDDRLQALVAAGLEIVSTRSCETWVKYLDVAALVSHLAGMPWVVPGFSVDRDLACLVLLYEA